MLAGRLGPVALVQFDAHGDTWNEYFGERSSHGTTLTGGRGRITPDKSSLQVGMRGSLYHADDLRAAEELGFR